MINRHKLVIHHLAASSIKNYNPNQDNSKIKLVNLDPNISIKFKGEIADQKEAQQQLKHSGDHSCLEVHAI